MKAENTNAYYSLIKENMTKFQEPDARQIPKLFTIHGDTRRDDYYWLNDRNNPEVISYLEEENSYLENVLEPVKDLRKTLYDEMRSRIKQDDNTVPYQYRGYSYYTRFETGKEYPIYCRKKINTLPEEELIILDVNELAVGNKFCNATAPQISPDNKLAVYAMDITGRNLHHAFIKNLETGDIVQQNSPVVSGNFVWAPDSKALFFDTKDPITLRTDKVWLHFLGTPFENDLLIYVEEDETSYANLSSSKDERYLFIHSGYTENVECHFLDLSDYRSKPILVKKRSADFYYSVDYFNGHFLILTNDHAKNFRLAIAPVDQYDYSEWKELVPHREDVLIQDLEIFKDYFVLFERKSGLNQIHVIPWKHTELGYYLEFRDKTYDCWFGVNRQLETSLLRLHYTSLTTPITTYDFDLSKKEFILLKENPVIGTFNKDHYQSEYLHVKSRDGVEVPLSIVYKKDIIKNGKAPLLLYAYGSYGLTTDASFSSNLLSLLDRGFIFAMAHVRGGKENGWNWYEDGKMLKKMNTFYDYIDCSEFLIQHQFTSSDRLFGRGGSAGGLLMGVVYNLKPELFKGLMAHVPFVDVLTTMSDPSIPLTTGEYTEWGNPNIKEEYEYMKSYSPFDNVTTKKYTNLLVTTGFSDSQVQYWEPAKWVAKLRKLRTDKNDLLLFHTNLDAGHGGASGRFERLKEIALEYAFMLALVDEL